MPLSGEVFELIH